MGKLAQSSSEPYGSPEWSVSALFLSSDRGEPVHVHVTRERKAAKFWLVPVRLEYNHGFAPTELNRVEGIVCDHEIQLVQAWHDYFKSGN
jgi:hypothetical protein